MRAGELGEDRQICMERRSTLDAVRVHAESAALGLLRRCPPEPLAPRHPPVRRSVPLAFREPAESDQAHQRDDEPHPEAPHDHQDDAHDDEDATKANPARVAACTFCHRTAPSTIAPGTARLSRVGSKHPTHSRTRVLSLLSTVGGTPQATSAASRHKERCRLEALSFHGGSFSGALLPMGPSWCLTKRGSNQRLLKPLL